MISLRQDETDERRIEKLSRIADVLVDPEGCECGCGDAECHEHDAEVYIMKIVVNGEFEEFLPADEDKMEILSKIVEERFEEMEDEEDEEEETED